MELCGAVLLAAVAFAPASPKTVDVRSQLSHPTPPRWHPTPPPTDRFTRTCLQEPPAPATRTTVDWAAAPITTRTTPSCQVVVEPPMWPTSKIRETQLHWLSALGEQASPVFWQSWFVYPHSGVAQLQPGEWDFSQITPLLEDMLNATQGRELCFQFGTVPEWMLSGPQGERRWDYGTEKWNETLVWRVPPS